MDAAARVSRGRCGTRHRCSKIRVRSGKCRAQKSRASRRPLSRESRHLPLEIAHPVLWTCHTVAERVNQRSCCVDRQIETDMDVILGKHFSYWRRVAFRCVDPTITVYLCMSQTLLWRTPILFTAQPWIYAGPLLRYSHRLHFCSLPARNIASACTTRNK